MVRVSHAGAAEGSPRSRARPATRVATARGPDMGDRRGAGQRRGSMARAPRMGLAPGPDMLARATALLALAAAAACVDPADDLATDDLTAPDGDDTGKADAATELKVRVGDTSVWVSSVLARKPYNGGQAWVLHARTSRTLTDANAFIFDDVFGEVTQPSPRTLDVAFGTTSSGPMLDGVNQFLSMGFAPSAGRPDHLTVTLCRLVATVSRSTKTPS